MQKINILGMNLTDYSVREAVGITDRFLGSGSLNTILFISAKILVGVGVSEEQQAWMADADLIVWTDAEIVKQAGIRTKDRIHEVEDQSYIREVLKRLGRGKKSLYLLAESEEKLEELEADLKGVREGLNIIGRSVADGMVQEEWDDIANRVNELAPVAVISRIGFEHQMRMMEGMKRILNAEIWLALDHRVLSGGEKEPFLKKLLSKWYHLLFQKQLSEYQGANRQDEKK